MNMPPAELPKYIQSCLAQGFTQAQVADSLGVDASYISQVCAQFSITEAPLQQFAAIDELYEELELKALKQLKLLISSCTKPMDLLRIATSINGAKRRSLGSTTSVQVQQATATGIVRLGLPKAAVSAFVMNEQNEAIGWKEEAEGKEQVRTLLTATQQQLTQMATEHKVGALLSSAPPKPAAAKQPEEFPPVADEDM